MWQPPGVGPGSSNSEANVAVVFRIHTSRLFWTTGPRGVARTAQAVQAVLSLARESVQGLQGGAPDTPPVVLRKLFERLGAT